MKVQKLKTTPLYDPKTLQPSNYIVSREVPDTLPLSELIDPTYGKQFNAIFMGTEEECLEFVEKYSITDSSNILIKH